MNKIWSISEFHLQSFITRREELQAHNASIWDLFDESDPQAEGDELPFDVVDGVAMIDVNGTIFKGASKFLERFLDVANPSRVAQEVDMAAGLDEVESIFLKIDSPGGTVAGTSLMADAVFAAREKKPVVAFADDCACSAAYWLASQATSIFANDTATVGSIGVYSVVPDFSKALEGRGIKIHVVRTGEKKGIGVPGTPIDDAALAEIQSSIDAINDRFVSAVARGRGMEEEEVRTLNDGGVFIGQKAVDVGLVDSIGNLSVVTKNIQEITSKFDVSKMEASVFFRLINQ